MKELETLLNQLIKLGWEPFGEKNVKIEKIRNGFRFISPLIGRFTSYSNRSLREIVSLESGLWQICTERELTKSKTSEHMINRYIKELITREEGDFVEADVLCTDLDPEWRLMESALIPEEELVKFLVDNIKVKC